MANLKLKKKNYLGVGYIHTFLNNETGEATIVPCTEQEYLNIGSVKPTLEGHTWEHSAGGTIKVDNPDSTLGVGEYVEIGDEVVVRTADSDLLEQFKKAPKEDLDKTTDEIDETKLKDY